MEAVGSLYDFCQTPDTSIPTYFCGRRSDLEKEEESQQQHVTSFPAKHKQFDKIAPFGLFFKKKIWFTLPLFSSCNSIRAGRDNDGAWESSSPWDGTRFRRGSEQGSSQAGEQQQTELLTLHLLHLARCRHAICEKKTFSSPHHILICLKTMTYGWLEEPTSVPKRVIF